MAEKFLGPTDDFAWMNESEEYVHIQLYLTKKMQTTKKKYVFKKLFLELSIF